MQTPFTVAGVRGTEFLVSVEATQAEVTVFEGTVVAENQSGKSHSEWRTIGGGGSRESASAAARGTSA